MDNYNRTIAYNRFGLFMILWDLIKKRKRNEYNKTLIFLCKCDGRHKISEREFYNDASGAWSGTRLLCIKCGNNKFIKDKKRPSFKKKERHN